MELSFDLLSTLTLMGALQGIFLSIVIFRYKKGNQKANRMLALLMLSFSICIISGILLPTRLYLKYPHLIKAGLPFLFLIAPLFYLYVRSLTTGTNFSKNDLFHFLPLLLAVLYELPFYFMSGYDKIYYVARMSQTSESAGLIGLLPWASFQLQMWGYLIYVSRMARMYESAIRESLSAVEEINISWIQYFINSLIIVHIIFVILSFLLAFGLSGEYVGRMISVVVSLVIYGLGYRGLMQPEIFTVNVADLKDDEKIKKKYLSEEQKSEFLQKLDRIMLEDKPFLDPELTLPDLAAMIGISRNHLSQLINEETGGNFFEYINGYRIEVVKKELHDPEKSHIKIIEIAFNAGFNSKAAFNSFFKKSAGFTPSEFRKQNK